MTLRAAFDRARAEKTIDVILDPFLATTFYVIAKEVPGLPPHVYLQPSLSGRQAQCVTVSESRAALANMPEVILLEKTGRQLLDELKPGLDIVMVYEAGGGECLTADQLAWLREKVHDAEA